MEDAEWMSEALREEIEGLQHSHGLVGDEAVAFWHLTEARRLMVDLAIDRRNKVDEVRKKEYEALSSYERLGQTIADSTNFNAEVRTHVLQHIDALYKELGHRALSRSYPGWDWELASEEDSDKEA